MASPVSTGIESSDIWDPCDCAHCRKVPRRENPYPAAEGWGDFATDLPFERPWPMDVVDRIAVDGDEPTFSEEVEDVLDSVTLTLLRKNEAYGNSALEPIRIFSTSDAAEQLRVRIDDKLSRIKTGRADNEDTLHDLIGYLVLLTIATKRAQQ